MRQDKVNYHKLIKAYNRQKGYGRSVKKAVLKAMEEEGATGTFATKDGVISAFLSYSIMKSYIRFYKWFTKNVFFKRGKMKFILYSLDVFTQSEGKEAFEEVKKELLAVKYGRNKSGS